MNVSDLNPFFIGFDRLWRGLDPFSSDHFRLESTGFPRYDIRKTSSDGDYVIEMALAGFKPGDVDVYVRDGNMLVITNERREQLTQEEMQSSMERSRSQAWERSRSQVYRGLSQKQFSRTFTLAEGVQVTGAELQDGMLTVTLKHEQRKPEVKRIEVRSAHLIENQAAQTVENHDVDKQAA